MNTTDLNQKYQSIIDFLIQDLNTVRTGRASSAMVEDISVEAYGSIMQIKALANISIPEARQILIDPWDKSIIKNIEKGIAGANLGFNPINDGKIIRINLPEMTEDTRKELVKVVGQKCENARIEIRKIREDFKNEIKEEKDEDIKNENLEELDKITKNFNEKIENIKKKKEEDIMTI
ncbi:MAG TPA: ribosome recycling factor [bacterium]|jgi:ribosome recycling factor|nr:ribosome recycling factor [Patescibacteria group bacterium]HPO11028.1 ribosome recycling factor [bacterium]